METEHEYHTQLKAAGHKLKRDEDGNIDIFILEYEHHNGPGCVLCNETWCHHCKDPVKPCPKVNPSV